MDEKLINAEWARKTATAILGDRIQAQVSKCLKAIASAVQQNKMSVEVTMEIDDLTKKDLQNRGFKISKCQSDPRDNINQTSYLISW